MNYFTPERLLRLQDHSDERQFLAALDDWERAVDSYRKYLNAIQRKLCNMQPQSPSFERLLKLLTSVALHDARVRSMDWGGVSRFCIILDPESEPGRLVILTYSLTQPPQITSRVLPQQICSETEPLSWLYDELSLEDQTDNGKLVFRHAILLSDGREVQLRFCSVRTDRSNSMMTAVPVGSVSV